MPTPWGAILSGLMGPYGVIVALGLVIFFLWRLFREEQAKSADAWDTVKEQVASVEKLTTELEIRRER